MSSSLTNIVIPGFLVFFFFFTAVAVDVVEGAATSTVRHRAVAESGADSTITLTDDDGPILYKFTVQINSTTVGSFNFQLIPEWAPYGAARFQELVNSTADDGSPFFEDIRFFRVLKDRIAQFGISGNTNTSAYWRDRYIEDDPVASSNRRGTISYAKLPQPNSRTTQFFINLNYNIQYDAQGFAPIGYVAKGMDIVDQLYHGYGDSPSAGGTGPIQSKIHEEGDSYLENDFPLLSYILSVERIYEEQSTTTEEEGKDNKTSGVGAVGYYGIFGYSNLSISFIFVIILHQLLY